MAERGELRVEHEGTGAAVVALSGEHDLSIAAALGDALDALVDADVGIVVDLTQAQLLDSSVFAVILRTRREARERGLPFGIVVDDTTGAPVLRLVAATGLVSDLSAARHD